MAKVDQPSQPDFVNLYNDIFRERGCVFLGARPGRIFQELVNSHDYGWGYCDARFIKRVVEDDDEFSVPATFPRAFHALVRIVDRWRESDDLAWRNFAELLEAIIAMREEADQTASVTSSPYEFQIEYLQYLFSPASEDAAGRRGNLG